MTDRPYPYMVEAAIATAHSLYDIHAGTKAPTNKAPEAVGHSPIPDLWDYLSPGKTNEKIYFIAPATPSRTKQVQILHRSKTFKQIPITSVHYHRESHAPDIYIIFGAGCFCSRPLRRVPLPHLVCSGMVHKGNTEERTLRNQT